MITLKNIKKEGDKMLADCYPESEKTMIKVSITGNDFDSFKFSPDTAKNEWRQHLNHARNALIDMANGEMDMNDGIIMWY